MLVEKSPCLGSRVRSTVVRMDATSGDAEKSGIPASVCVTKFAISVFKSEHPKNSRLTLLLQQEQC